MDEQCIICYECDSSLIKPKNCKCNVFLHNECLEKCKKLNILCPICRKKNTEHIDLNNNQNSIIDYPLLYFLRSPGLLSFIFLTAYSFFISFFVLLPYFIVNITLNRCKITINNIFISVLIFYGVVILLSIRII